MKRCEKCVTTDGMVEGVDDIVWCDHGELAAKVAEAEARDRATAARICPTHDLGYGPCRCPE